MSQTNSTLTDFPLVFADMPGKVNSILIQKICSIREKPAKSARELLAHCGPVKVDAEQAFPKLSELISLKDFRERWYQEREDNKIALWHFYQLAHTYTSNKHKCLGYKSEQLSRFYTPRTIKGTSILLPKLEIIQLLVDQIKKVSLIDLQDSAIYSWSLIESTLWNVRAHPTEASLINFPDVFLASLATNGLHDVLGLLRPGKWSNVVEVKKEIEQPAIQSPKRSTKALTHIDKKNNAVTERIQPLISDLELRFLDYDKCVTLLSGKIKDLASTKCPEDTFLEIQNTIELTKTTFSSIQKIEEKIVAGTFLTIPKILKSLGIDFTEQTLHPISPDNRKDWIIRINNSLEFHDKLFAFHSDFLAKSIDVQKKFKSLTCVAIINITELNDKFDSLENDVIICEAGIAAKFNVKDIIRSRFNNFDWNPLLTSEISEKSWHSLGILIIRENSLGQLTGILVRHLFKTLGGAFGEMLTKICSRTIEDRTLENLLESLNYLTLGQLENLAVQFSSLTDLIAIAELKAVLEMNFIAQTETFKYWSAVPINDIVSRPNQSAFDQFFQQVYKIFAESNERSFGIADLRRLLIKTSIVDNIDKENQPVEDELRHRLDEILRYYKRGQNTYGELWSRAYTTVIAPIKEIAKEYDLRRVSDAISQLKEIFRVDDYLSEWKTHIPEHLRKRSEYDKHIRSQVETKINDLLLWNHDYIGATSNSTPSHRDEFEALEKCIRDIYCSNEQNSQLLKQWLDLVKSQDREYRTIPWSLSQSEDADWSEPALGANLTPSSPRAYLAANITFGALCADRLIESFGHNSVLEVATNYANQGFYEEYFALSSIVSEALPLDLDRKVEFETDELERKQRERIDIVKKKQVQFLDPADSLELYIEELETLLVQRAWTRLEAELSEVEYLVLDMESLRAENVSKALLGVEIVQLGGNYDSNMSKTELLQIKDELYANTYKRRLHVVQIEKILDFTELDSDVANTTRAAVENLSKYTNLPDEQQSHYVAYLFEQMVKPLYEELIRQRTLLPSYGIRVKTLAMNLMANIEKISFSGAIPPFQITVFETTSEKWAELPKKGEEAVNSIANAFQDAGLVWADSSFLATSSDSLNSERPGRIKKSEENLVEDSALIVARFIQKLKLTASSKLSSGPKLVNLAQLDKEISNASWDGAANIAYRLYLSSTQLSALEMRTLLTNWAISSYLADAAEFDIESMAALFRLINSNYSARAVQSLLPTKHSKGLLGELIVRFLKKVATAIDPGLEKNSTYEHLTAIAAGISSFGHFKICLRIAFATNDDDKSITAKAFWDYWAGDSRQAEIRAAFMTLVWKSSLPKVLTQCLIFSPNEIADRKASALALIADQILDGGKFDLVQSFMDMRSTVTAKPFHLFVASLLSTVPTSVEQAADLSIVGKLSKVDEKNSWQATLNIVPRKSDCPDMITLTLEQHSPIRFSSGFLECSLTGPFFEPTVVLLEFIADDISASLFTLEVVCDAISITGKRSRFVSSFNIDFSTSHRFKSLSGDEIEEAFSNFPEYQMRGNDYVSRIEDERKIEKALFGRTVRSLWISSPRRSGKTTMLYRILDDFSHKAGRDNLVVYLTLDKSFSNVAEFNSWVWTRLRTIPANKELRSLYPAFDDIGRDLPWDADAGTFLGALSNGLLKIRPDARIIFLIDEIDKFASMHYSNGLRKDTAAEIMWQLRYLISEQRNIGFVFAGSSAAKRIFVTNSDAPFFNGISLLELTPFSTKTPQEERCAREIVAPLKTHAVYNIPKRSLDHLIWVCAGIPYYMKLVSGATMATARQSHILISDINDGLRALLQRGTGVMKLDEMSGEPGSDELRTMAIETGTDKLLTLAVLYSMAETYSALGGQPISRGSLSSPDNPLVTRYELRRKQIETGLDLCIESGFLRNSVERIGDIEFTIPILGESLRNASGKLWASIDHELRVVSKEIFDGKL